MVGWPSAANGGGDALRFRHGRYDRDIGKQRQTAQRAVHVQRLKLSRRDHEYQFPVPLATRTMLPEWFGLRKALPNGPVTFMRCPMRIFRPSSEDTTPSGNLRM